jgi:hypothetical protein
MIHVKMLPGGDVMANPAPGQLRTGIQEGSDNQYRDAGKNNRVEQVQEQQLLIRVLMRVQVFRTGLRFGKRVGM